MGLGMRLALAENVWLKCGSACSCSYFTDCETRPRVDKTENELFYQSFSVFFFSFLILNNSEKRTELKTTIINAELSLHLKRSCRIHTYVTTSAP